MTLHKSSATAPNDYSHRWWDYMNLDNIVASAVRITALTLYTNRCNGLMEVEFYIGKGNRACDLMVIVVTATPVPLHCYQVPETHLKSGNT